MTVSNVAPTYTPVISNVPISPDSLDATTVVSYCVSRLNSLDHLIQERFADQQSKNAAIKQASNVINILNTFPAGISEGCKYKDEQGVDRDASEAHRDVGVRLAQQYQETTDPGLRQKILEEFQLVTGKAMLLNCDGSPAPLMLDPKADPNLYLDRSNIHHLDANAWQAKIGDIKSLQDSLTKDNELSMISLQSIVSQRQLGIQMTTQMLSSMNDGSKQVVNNWKV